MNPDIPLPRIVFDGIASYRISGERFLVSNFVRADDHDRQEFYDYLVAIGRPFASKQGTPSSRYRRLILELVGPQSKGAGA